MDGMDLSSCGASPLSGNKDIWYTDDLGCGFVLDAIQYENRVDGEKVKIKGERGKWPLFSRSKFIKEHLEKRNVQCIVGGTFVTSSLGLQEFAKAIGDKPTILYSGSFSGTLNIEKKVVDKIVRESCKSCNLNIQQVGHFYRSANASELKKDTFGTFHPKFVLIFMEEGLAIAISTSNMTGSTSLEGTWSGFVPRINPDRTVKASFGVHLQNFLESCEEQRLNYHTENKYVLSEFLRKNAKTGLSELHCTFEFSKLNHINLISTVPGRRFKDKDCKFEKVSVCEQCYNSYYTRATPPDELQESYNLNKTPFEYGIFRINEVLRDHDEVQKRQSELRCEFYKSLDVESIEFLDDERKLRTGRLIVQTTSTGAKLGIDFFRGFLGQLLPELGINDEEIGLQKLMLVWATQHFTNGCFPLRSSSYEAGEVGVDHSNSDVYKADGNVMKFMEPEDLKTILGQAPRCLHQWESLLSLGENPSDFKKLLNHIHHIKTILRPLYESNKMRQARIQDDAFKCTCRPLQWCLLGSSCMSIGAQGSLGPLPPLCAKQGCRSREFLYKEHRNFELGVMFISNKNTEYRALDGNCPIHCPDAPGGGSWCNSWQPNGKRYNEFYSHQTVKVLPIPYKIDCSSYNDGDLLDDMPAFHMRKNQNILWCVQNLPFTQKMKELIHGTIKTTNYDYLAEDLLEDEAENPVQSAFKDESDNPSSFHSSVLSGDEERDDELERVMGKSSIQNLFSEENRKKRRAANGSSESEESNKFIDIFLDL